MNPNQDPELNRENDPDFEAEVLRDAIDPADVIAGLSVSSGSLQGAAETTDDESVSSEGKNYILLTLKPVKFFANIHEGSN
jgi:hypothetical protein